MRKRLYALLGIILFTVAIQTTMSVQAAEPLVVVIDPGHGGDNLGTDYLPIPEKDYDFIVAMYMKAYLEQYQDVKVYLTASTHTRAMRRFLELQEKGQVADLEKIAADIADRDYRDMHRETSPLRQAEDAILIDSSDMTIEENVQAILNLMN